jgi:hypothetical protein
MIIVNRRKHPSPEELINIEHVVFRKEGNFGSVYVWWEENKQLKTMQVFPRPGNPPSSSDRVLVVVYTNELCDSDIAAVLQHKLTAPLVLVGKSASVIQPVMFGKLPLWRCLMNHDRAALLKIAAHLRLPHLAAFLHIPSEDDTRPLLTGQIPYDYPKLVEEAAKEMPAVRDYILKYHNGPVTLAGLVKHCVLAQEMLEEVTLDEWMKDAFKLPLGAFYQKAKAALEALQAKGSLSRKTHLHLSLFVFPFFPV